MLSKDTSQKIEQAMTRLGIIDRVSNRAVDLFKMALLESFANTHLPEMYDVLGTDAFLKLLDVFEDSTFFTCPNCSTPVKFPTTQQLEEILRDIGIYLRLSNTKTGSVAPEVRNVAKESGLSPGQVRSIFYRMEKRATRYKITVKK